MNSDAGRERARAWWRPPVSWKVLIPTVAALGIGIGGAVAVASIPGSDGTITGCYVTNTQVDTNFSVPIGSLRVIDPSDTNGDDPAVSTCTSGEATLTWNQQGPPGANGAPGESGATGAAGTIGATGATGGLAASPGSNSKVIMALTPSNANLGGLTSVPVGESQVPGTQNQEFDVTSFDLGIQNALNIGSASTGAGAGKVTFQPFTVTKPVDKYSSDLFKYLAAGKRFSSAEIMVRKANSNGQADPVAQYLMKDVVITSIHVSGTAKETTETLQGEYGAIQFVYYGQAKNGTFTPVSAGGWNRVTNTDEPVTQIGLASSKHHRRHR